MAFVAVVADGVAPQVSDESLDVAWFDVDALPGETPPDLPVRLARVGQLVRDRRP